MNNAITYTGRPNLSGLVLLPSTTVTASGTGAAVGNPPPLGEYALAVFQLDVTAAATAAGDTLDVYVQTTIDGTNWLDCVHFTQIVGNGGAKRYISKLLADAALAEYATSTALAAASQRPVFGDAYRINYVVVNADAPSFTLSVKANFQ